MHLVLPLLLLAAQARAADAKIPKPMAPLPALAATPITGPKFIDETALLKSLQQAVRAGSAGVLPAEARLHKFLFAPGFSWDAIPNYFEPNIRRLRALGLDAKLVPTDPLGTTTDNGRHLAKEIKKSRKPVILIGHSKGGIDAIAALQNDPVARRKVTKLVTIQSPWTGTSVADWFRAHPWLTATAMTYLRMLNPWRFWAVNPFFRHSTIVELSKAARAGIVDTPPFAPGDGPEVFSFGSRVTAQTAIKLMLWVSAGSVKQVTGADNDGIVSPEEAAVPESRNANFEHVGHIDTVSDPSSWKHKTLGVRAHDPKFAADFTEALVRWAFGPKP